MHLTRPWQPSPFVLRMQAQLAAATVILRATRLQALVAKANFNPAQPRLPRGVFGGGQWTDGGLPQEVIDSLDYLPRPRPKVQGPRYAQARGGQPNFRIIPVGRRQLVATPRQALEYELTKLHADAAIGLARQVNSRWNPTQSLHQTIHGEIAYQRSIPQQANAYLNSVLRRIGDNGGPPLVQPQPSPFQLLAPGGQRVGFNAKGAGPEIRTVLAADFDSLVIGLTRGLQFREPSRPTYDGVYYYYNGIDRCVYGLRMSDRHGMTIDIIESNRSDLLESGDKFHRGK